MPYIKKERREELDAAIGNLVYILKNVDEGQDIVGDINYIFTRIIYMAYSGGKQSYSKINAIIGIFECAKMEFYRRIAVPYEDFKARENGDVYR